MWRRRRRMLDNRKENIPRGGSRRRLRLEPLEQRRMLAGVTVGNNLDVVNGNTTSIADLIANDGGDGISLREAILAANATPGADEITLDAVLSGQTILLGGTELVISEALAIDATTLEENLTINANQQSRVINITATTGDFTLAGLTLTGGRTTGNNASSSDSTFSGGAIRSFTSGNLTIDRCTINESGTTGYRAHGGGIFSRNTVTLTRSTVSGNSTTGSNAGGGGISAEQLTLIQSEVSDNNTVGSGAIGGGIRTITLTLTASTVSGNSTTGSNAHGGGIFASSMTLIRSTVSNNNTAGQASHGSGIYATSAVTLDQSTVTKNHATHTTAKGGGVFQNILSNPVRPFSISGSIVAGNTAGGGEADVVKDQDSTLTVNYSLIGTGVTPDFGGNNVVTDNPQLGPLADNGGPTKTHALLVGNPAINAGDPNIVSNSMEFDQRENGFLRVHFGRIDIGAFEYQFTGLPPQGLVVDAIEDSFDNDFSIGNLSLREAILLANDNSGPDTITFDTSLSAGTILLSNGEMKITETLAIDGTALAENVTIDANQQSRIFNITATTGDFILAGLTLTKGRTTGDNASSADSTFSGGAIRSLTTGNVMLDRSLVSESSTGGVSASGGGIFARGAVTLTQSTVSNNRTAGSNALGGGVFAVGAVTLTESTVSGNSTMGSGSIGGGIRANTATLTESTVSNNSTAGSSARGGGVFAVGAVTLTKSIVSGNSTSGQVAHGGGIHAGAVAITESTVSGNSTAGGFAEGGGINASTLTLTASTVSGNSTVGQSAFGGGIRAITLTLTQSTVSNNSTAGSNARGGGICAFSTVTLFQSTVTNNHATHATAQGGGVFQFNDTRNSPSLSISGSIVAGNTAGGGGADVRKDDPDGTLTVNYSLIGTGVSPDVGGNNVVRDNPQLAPLADNGGPTWTHALLPTSPAINAGDPSIPFDPDEFDQRGTGFPRVQVGRIDIGAFESTFEPFVLAGDYNDDGFVNAADYVVWRDTLGSTTNLAANGDDSNNVIDEADYDVWKANFGAPEGGGASASIAGGSQPPESIERGTDTPVRPKSHRLLDGGQECPPHGFARTLALLDLLDSLPERERKPMPIEWDFAAGEESQPAAREEAFVSCFAMDWQ